MTAEEAVKRGARDRLSGDPAPLLCAGRARHGGGVGRSAAEGTSRVGRIVPHLGRQSGPDRRLSQPRHRSGCGRDLRRRSPRSSSPASWSISRKPGVHSGDSACSLPPHTLKPAIIAEIERQTKAMAVALNVRGLMNVQYAIQGDEIYVLEVNPRASRTVPFVAKAIGLPVAAIAVAGDGGRETRQLRSQATASGSYLGQGSGAALRPLPRRGHGPGTGDALHRRSDGRGRQLRPRLRQEPDRRRHAAADGRHGVHLGQGCRQGR